MKSSLAASFLFTLTFLSVSCERKLPDPLSEIETSPVGEYVDIPCGRLYLPMAWSARDVGAWPVTVILRGYATFSRSLSARPSWVNLAEDFGIALLFVETGRMGWRERRDSEDTGLIVAVLRSLRRKAWVKPGGIQLFGWSAGAIMAQGLAGYNRRQADGKPLIDRIAAVSGGFGMIMDEEVVANPRLDGIVPVPLFISWGEQEPPDHGRTAAALFRALGWPVETTTQPDGHVLVDEQIRAALSRNAR